MSHSSFSKHPRSTWLTYLTENSHTVLSTHGYPQILPNDFTSCAFSCSKVGPNLYRGNKFLACISFFPQSSVSHFKFTKAKFYFEPDGKIFLLFSMLGKFRMKNYFLCHSEESNFSNPQIWIEGNKINSPMVNCLLKKKRKAKRLSFCFYSFSGVSVSSENSLIISSGM